MDKVVKRKWLSALRSKRYKQGRNALRVHDNYCCLGVLCDLHSKEHINKWKKSSKDWIGGHFYLGEYFTLPIKVQEWAGINLNPTIKVDNESTTVGELNDKGYTFEQIANLIEAQL